jgi:hypothetical protein
MNIQGKPTHQATPRPSWQIVSIASCGDDTVWRAIPMREAEDSFRREQLFVHFAYLRICVAHVANKTTNNNKYTEDTIRWEPFHSGLL